VEEKGILSIENFLNARRLMYWQVYLHKTTVSAERMVVNLIKRAQHLVKSGESLTCTESLLLFLKNSYTIENFKENQKILNAFGKLDYHDLWGAVKLWQTHNDFILSTLSTMLLQRKLFQIRMSTEPIRKDEVDQIRTNVAKSFNLLRSESSYFFSYGYVTNEAYTEGQKINILMKNGELLDIAQASDLPNIKAISKIVKKNYLCWPKNVSL
jgi:HD superfamily phosphohydrolase